MRFENFENVLCAWPEKSVLYNFHGKRTVFPFCIEFEASVTILRTLTLKNAIWRKRAAHDLKREFCTIFMESALFSLFGEIFRPVWRFLTLWPSQMRFAKTCSAWPEKSALYNFYGKRTVFPFWREFKASVTILTTLTLKNAIWPKRALHDLKNGFCTIFMKSALFSPFGENLRPVWRFRQLWRSKMRFDQNVLRMTWKERFVQFPWKAHCFPVLQRIWGQCDDFENFDAHKCELAKTCCSWPKKRVLYNFYGKRTVFPFRREFETSVTIFRTLTLTNAILLKRAAHDLKRAFCTIFMETALFSTFGKNFRPVWRIWELWRSQMRFGQNVLRMTWKERFVQFSWKAHCFPLFGENLRPVWRTLTTLTLTNAIWPKRAPHDLKRAFCTIFMESALFSRFAENLRPVWRFWQVWRSQMRFGQNVLRMTWKERFVQFSFKAHCFPVLKRIWGQCDDFDNFDAQKCDLAKTCSAWPEKSVLYNFYGKRTVFSFWREFEASVTI